MDKKKILLVDDNPDIVEMMAVRLESYGYEVIKALNGREAVDIASLQRPDLILLDIAMPGMDGFEVGALLKQNIETRDIPIIMATARGAHKDILKAITEVGALDYIVKPFRPQELLDKILAALDKSSKKEKTD